MSWPFDVIVGNPPYQIDMDTGNGGRTANIMPLYHKFVERAIELNPGRVVMITPSRWFNGGKGLDAYRKAMLNDRHIKALVDYPDADDVFPGVRIAGGVSYFVWDRDHDGDCEFTSKVSGRPDVTVFRDLREGQGGLVRDARALLVVNKVVGAGLGNLSDIVSKRDPFGQSITTNYKFAQPTPFDGSIPLIYVNRVEYVRPDQVQRHYEWIDQYKVLIPKAYGTSVGLSLAVIGQPIALAPGSACTQSYLVAGRFDTAEEAENYAHYLCTKFVRFLVLQRKSTQDVKPDKFLFVPQMDFTRRWTDQQLYDHFGLTDDERSYIEAAVRDREPILSLDSPIPASHLPGGFKYKQKGN